MHFEQLRVQNLRCLEDLAITLDPGINVFVGSNGAGKTSILEAVFLLSHARSFRSGAREALLRRDSTQLSIFAELRRKDTSTRMGLGREAGRWQARLDGSPVPLGRLVQECAVVCFDPGSHALISGAAEERRRFLDWGVFHVEHEFFAVWRRYQRALKQRNSLLRSSASTSDALFEPWEVELADSAHQMDRQRQSYFELLLPLLSDYAARLLPELGSVVFRYRRGWQEGDGDLLGQLRDTRNRDSARGHTTIGAHRADWSLGFEAAPQREHFSRGQEKLVATACLLAQAALYAQICGDWPVICLDDLASELDQSHQCAVVDELVSARSQILVTGTDMPSALQSQSKLTFHVEQGAVAALL